MAHYSHDAIKEAILDIRVLEAESSVWKMIDGLQTIHEDFPNRQEIIGAPAFHFDFTTPQAPAFSGTQELVGIRYASEDGRYTLQSRLDGFSFNCVGKYDSWDVFLEKARALWDSYRDACRPQIISRVGLRYVNRFHLPPHDPIILGDYFALTPLWNKAELGSMNGFQMQLAIPQPDFDAVLLLTQATIPSENTMDILLDIDVFREDLQWDAADNSTLWKCAESLRQCKNKVFESCLKEPVREMIR